MENDIGSSVLLPRLAEYCVTPIIIEKYTSGRTRRRLQLLPSGSLFSLCSHNEN